MNDPVDRTPPDDLDRLLQAWATARQATSGHLSALQRDIMGQLATQRAVVPPDDDQVFLQHSTGARWAARVFWPRSHLGSFLAGAALILLGVTAATWLVRARPSPEPTADPLPLEQLAGLTSLPPEQLVAKARLFAEMQAVFGNDLDWIAETTDRIEIGLIKDRAALRHSGLLVVRMVVERRSAEATDWKTVWSADVVAPNEESVMLRPTPGISPAGLSLWAYRLPDGMVFVESKLILSDRQGAILSSSESILDDNRPTEVSAVDADGAQYRVLHLAANLDDLG